MLVYYFLPFIVSNRYLLFWVSNDHNSVTVQNRTHVYMNFFHHKDLGNHLLQLCPKVVKHPVYCSFPVSQYCITTSKPFSLETRTGLIRYPGININWITRDEPFYITCTLLGLVLTCDAKEKLGPGDLFLLGAGGALFAAPPDWEPFRFRRLFAGRCDSEGTHRQATIVQLPQSDLCCRHDNLNKKIPLQHEWRVLIVQKIIWHFNREEGGGGPLKFTTLNVCITTLCHMCSFSLDTHPNVIVATMHKVNPYPANVENMVSS